MIRRLVFVIIFLLAFCLWLVWYLPAQVVISQVTQQLDAANVPVTLDQASGRAWSGHARWTWQSQVGEVDWRLVWRAWRPGVALTVSGNDLAVNGWVSGSRHRLILESTHLQIPLALLSTVSAEVRASGHLRGDITRLDIADSRVRALNGKLEYSGGQGRWQQESATLPPMKAQLGMEKTVARMVVTDENQRQLAIAELMPDGIGRLQVLRAYAEAVGMSQGQGAPTDVILKFEQPLLPAANHQ